MRLPVSSPGWGCIPTAVWNKAATLLGQNLQPEHSGDWLERFKRVKHVHLLESGLMQKKLTITLDETVYDGLHRVIGRRRISRFIEELVRPHILAQDLEVAYQHMAQDETREAEALAWSEATVSDVSDAPR